MVFTNRDQARAFVVHDHVRVTNVFRGRDRHRRLIRLLYIEPLIAVVREPDHAFIGEVGTAPILVYASARVEGGRGDIDAAPTPTLPRTWGGRFQADDDVSP